MAITLQHDGDVWRILAEGAARDGKIYCHLASTTRFRQQKNGLVPLQMCDWIEQERILSAAQQAEEKQRAQALRASPSNGQGEPR